MHITAFLLIPATVQEEMLALDRFIGEWEGAGWIDDREVRVSCPYH